MPSFFFKLKDENQQLRVFNAEQKDMKFPQEYKFPVETNKFYTDVAENVDNEIKSTGKDGCFL